jgi:dienelactone hydrolase
MRLLGAILLLLSSCAFAQAVRFETAVVPLPNEDIAVDCHYTLTIPSPEHPVRAVWVIFDRGHDVHDLFSDLAVLDFAKHFHLALLLHGHCPGKSPEDHRDMNMDPAKGLGRALFTALDQFAQTTGHKEITGAQLIFLGFSGAGPLSARFVAAFPERTIAAILSYPGHYEPNGINTVNLDTPAIAVPQMILAGGADDRSGTFRPYEYFKKYREQRAPWLFILQNKSPHCCTANAKDLMLQWLGEVIKQRHPSSTHDALRNMNQNDGWLALIKTQDTKIVDSFGLMTFDLADSKIQKSRGTVPQGWLPSGWISNHTLAQKWLSFVRQPQHPILPLQ